MCRFSQCCCCKLVVGVYVIAGWTIGICGLGVGLSIYAMRTFDLVCSSFRFDRGDDSYEGGLRPTEDYGTIALCKNSIRPTYIVVCIMLAFLSIWLLSAGGLIGGALKKKRHAYIPWIVVTSIVLGLNALAACCLVYVVVTNLDTVLWNLAHSCILYILVLGDLTVTGIWIYSLTVICNHFRQLKQEQLQAPDFAHLTANIVIEPIESMEKQKEALSANYM